MVSMHGSYTLAKTGAPETLLTEVQGADLRALHSMLLALDKGRRWGDLRRTLTPTGDYFWLCAAHRRQYEPGPPRMD